MENNTVQALMEEFCSQTGLPAAGTGAGAARRYLWTDAFGVCNYLTLYEQSGREAHLQMALNLVDQVHEVLGCHRDDDPRRGWISGLDERQGRLHPTAGGLRIGKKMQERQPGEPFDESLEWERDGQYYHYLTKWMHALCCVNRAIDNPVYTAWAKELAERVHNAFCFTAGGATKRLYWKMSIDLSRPQVDAMGHHDPLDGLITCLEIRERAVEQPEMDLSALDAAIIDLADMCQGVNWTTPDPLGLGGLLTDTWHLAQLQSTGAQIPLPGLLQDMLDAAIVGLSIYMRDNSMHLPAAHRLAFRELGLAIGLQAVKRIETLVARRPELFNSESRLDTLLNALQPYLPLQEQIERFWLEPQNRKVPSWKEHADINMVMLATSLAPGWYLDLQSKR
ncbi:MAG: hypothetical protein IME97_10120 [Proteobacteria bacterium]|nr:hypothetical protein [Pseudomonadota bacterium]